MRSGYSFYWSSMYASMVAILYTPAYRNSFQAPVAPLHVEPESLHALLILRYRRLAVGHGVRGLGHEHALIALRLLVLAHAARLWSMLAGRLCSGGSGCRVGSHLGLGGFRRGRGGGRGSRGNYRSQFSQMVLNIWSQAIDIPEAEAWALIVSNVIRRLEVECYREQLARWCWEVARWRV